MVHTRRWFARSLAGIAGLAASAPFLPSPAGASFGTEAFPPAV